jgi:hypothetical protein
VQTERNKRTGESPSVEAVAEALSEGQPEALQPLLLQENARAQKRASIVQVRTSRCCLGLLSVVQGAATGRDTGKGVRFQVGTQGALLSRLRTVYSRYCAL